MPLYEYQCDACEHRFEKIQKFSDPLEDTCPKCGGHVHKGCATVCILGGIPPALMTRAADGTATARTFRWIGLTRVPCP